MNNQELIKKYKNHPLIITKYSDEHGKLIDGITLPYEVDNRYLCSKTDDQGDTPTCAGHSIAQYLEAYHYKRTCKLVDINAFQLYARAKELDGSINSDGTNLEAVMQAGMEIAGLKNKQMRTYMSTRDQRAIDQVKMLLLKYDILLAGFAITSGWYNCNNTNYKIVHTNRNLGGHAVLLCGFSDEEGGFFIQNQWGINWGSKGFAVIPYDVFLKEFIYCGWLTNMQDEFD